MSQPSETSRPAVRHSPWTSASVGIGRDSRRRTTSSSGVNAPERSPPASTARWKPLTSAPPVNTSPSARQTSARASLASTSSRQATSASVVAFPNRLSGGSCNTSDATASSRSTRTGCPLTGTPWFALGPEQLLPAPPSPCAASCSRALPDAIGERLDLVRLARPRDPRELERVVLVTRDHMQVEVVDRLPSGRAARVEDVEAGRLERGPHPLGEATRGDGGSLEVLVRDLDQVSAMDPRDDERVPGSRRVDVHERDRVVVGVDDLRRHVAGNDPAEEAVARHPRGRLDEFPGQRDRVVPPGDLAGEDRGLDLRQQATKLGARINAQLGGELVAANRRGWLAVASPREGLTNHLARQVEMGIDRLLPRALPLGREAIGDGEQGHVNRVRIGGAKVVVHVAPRQRPLVDEEAESQVVERQVGEVVGEPPARAQPTAELADDPSAGAIVADEQDPPALPLAPGLRLSHVMKERREA